LRPTLVKKIVPLKLATCGELLEMAKLFVRAEEMTTPTGGEFGRRPPETEIGGAESGAAAPKRVYEQLFQEWLRSRADTAERAVDQHRGLVSDQPLLAIPARAPVRNDMATMMEQVLQRLDRLEAPSRHSGGRGGSRGRGSQRSGRGGSNSFVRRCFICKSEGHVARNCPKAQEEQKTGGNRSTPPDSNPTTAPLKCIAPVATEVARRATPRRRRPRWKHRRQKCYSTLILVI